jgi:hypothetical protein
MSTAAIFDVTQALRRFLRSRLRSLSSGALVTLLPPGDELPDVLGVNLYLYRVFESPYTRNRDWPGDRATPPIGRPALGLQLFYLLTPLGVKPENEGDAGDDAHATLGLAMTALHEHPVLNDVHIAGFDADVDLSEALRNSFEQVKVSLIPIDVDELSKIWASLNKPYRLSVAYEVSLVQLLRATPPPAGGGIVQRTGVDVIPIGPPLPAELAPPAGALARLAGGLVTANQLTIRGSALSFPGQTPAVRVGGQAATVLAAPAPTDQALTVALPLDLAAGPQVDVDVTLNGRTSTPLSFLVRPWLAALTPVRSDLAAGATLALAGEGLAPAQAVRFDGPGGSVSVTAFEPGGGPAQATVLIPAGLANGVFTVRLQIADGSLTNGRQLAVIPRLASATAAIVGGAHRLTLDGARLAGADVRLVLDGATYQVGANANAAQLVHTLGRLLDAGPHEVAVSVDGHRSHRVELVI